MILLILIIVVSLLLFVYAACSIGKRSDERMSCMTYTKKLGDPGDDSTWIQLTLDFDNSICYYQGSYQGKVYDIY
jgi:hypothetical protein